MGCFVSCFSAPPDDASAYRAVGEQASTPSGAPLHKTALLSPAAADENAPPSLLQFLSPNAPHRPIIRPFSKSPLSYVSPALSSPRTPSWLSSNQNGILSPSLGFGM